MLVQVGILFLCYMTINLKRISISKEKVITKSDKKKKLV